jgi:uncharacterized membrane protein (UPF0182 family)
MYPCAKIFLVVVNLAILIGAAIAGGLLYAQYEDLSWADFKDADLPAVFLLVVAAFAVLSAIIGLISICTGKCCRVLYLIIVIVVVLLEIAVGVVAFVYKNKILDAIEENWQKPDFERSRKKVEATLKCCGFDTPDVNVTCGFSPATNTTPTCENLLKEDIKKYGVQIGVVGISFAALQVLLIVAAGFLLADRPKDLGYRQGINAF